MGIIPKFLKKLKPLKILGNVVKTVVPGAAPGVQAIDDALKKAKKAKVSGPQVIASAIGGAIEGATDSIEAQISADAVKTTVQKYAVPGALILAGVLVVVLVARRR